MSQRQILTIQLRDMAFEAFHGVNEEERLIGNKFLVNCLIEIPGSDTVIRNLSDTVDYESVYKIIRDRMLIPSPLLETVAMETEILIHYHFPSIRKISIEIIKLHPLIEGFTGNSSVRWSKDYE